MGDGKISKAKDINTIYDRIISFTKTTELDDKDRISKFLDMISFYPKNKGSFELDTQNIEKYNELIDNFINVIKHDKFIMDDMVSIIENMPKSIDIENFQISTEQIDRFFKLSSFLEKNLKLYFELLYFDSKDIVNENIENVALFIIKILEEFQIDLKSYLYFILIYLSTLSKKIIREDLLHKNLKTYENKIEEMINKAYTNEIEYQKLKKPLKIYYRKLIELYKDEKILEIELRYFDFLFFEYKEFNKENYTLDNEKSLIKSIEKKLNEISNKTKELNECEEVEKYGNLEEYIEKYKEVIDKNQKSILNFYYYLFKSSSENNWDEDKKKLIEKILNIDLFESKKSLLKEVFNSLEETLDSQRENDFLIEIYESIGRGYRNLKNFEEAKKYLTKIQDLNSSDKIEELITAIEDEKDPHIKQVIIKNFKLFEETEPIKLDKKINIFIGKNSSGKTSILQAIALGLLPEYSECKNKIKDCFENCIRDKNKKLIIDIELTKGSKQTVKLFSNGEKNKNILYKDNRNKELKIFVLGYSANIFSKELNDEDYDKCIKKILEKNGRDYYVESLFEDYSAKFHNPLKLLNKLLKKRDEGEYVNKIENIDKIIKNFKFAINKFLSGKDLQFELLEEKNEFYFVDKQKHEEHLNLSKLSEGYRNHVLLLTDILIHFISNGVLCEFDDEKDRFENAHGIILIDEFDRHLHPEWQKHLLKNLQELFPEVQFILTTHNSTSILGRGEGEIKSIVRNNEEIKILNTNATKDIDVGMILLEYFGVNSLVDEDTDKILNEFQDLKIREKSLSSKDKKRLKNLNKQLKNTMFLNFIKDEQYFNFLKFLQYIKIDLEGKDIDSFNFFIGDYINEFIENLKKHYKKNF